MRAGTAMADTLSQLYLGAGLTVLSHPLMYVKVLIQVGHEPLAPSMGRNIFGRPVLQLPGLFAYAKHIVKIDGKRGLFKGLTSRLCSGAIGTVVHSKVLQSYRNMKNSECSDLGKNADPSSLYHVFEETTREMIARSTATLVTHPFHVITLRCMIQFIGRETKYSGIFSSVVTIYREEGILGFLAGLIPRLLGDVISLWLCNLLAYFINTYILEPPSQVSQIGELRSYSQAITGVRAVQHQLSLYLLPATAQRDTVILQLHAHLLPASGLVSTSSKLHMHATVLGGKLVNRRTCPCSAWV